MRLSNGIGVGLVAVFLCGVCPHVSLANNSSDSHPGVAARTKTPRVELLHVFLIAGNPNEINPCWFVKQNLYDRALRNANLGVEFTLSYTSRGVQFNETFTTSIQDAAIGDRATRAGYVNLESYFTTQNPVDADSVVSGTMRVVKLHQHHQGNHHEDCDADDDDDDDNNT
jgi:hypothetical protein